MKSIYRRFLRLFLRFVSRLGISNSCDNLLRVSRHDKVKKHVVISANTSWYLYNFRRGTISNLISSGNSVTAVSPADEYTDSLLRLGCSHLNIYIDRSGLNPIHEIRTIYSYFLVYRKLSPDVVLNFTPKVNIYSTAVAKLFGIKVVNNIAGLGTLFIDEKMGSKIATLLYRATQPLADYIFFQNNDDLEFFKSMNIISKSNRYERLPGSGVDLKYFSIAEAPNDEPVRFILVARMIKEKGVYFFVDAAKKVKIRYPLTQFYLLGPIDDLSSSGIDRHVIEQWESEGIVSYLGVTDDVREVVCRMDCCVLPSYYREGVPKSLLEAAAMGKPIITTDNVGCREAVVDGKSGFIVDPRNVDALVSAMYSIIELGHEGRLKMGRCAREYIEGVFDERRVIDRYLHVVEHVYTS